MGRAVITHTHLKICIMYLSPLLILKLGTCAHFAFKKFGRLSEIEKIQTFFLSLSKLMFETDIFDVEICNLFWVDFRHWSKVHTQFGQFRFLFRISKQKPLNLNFVFMYDFFSPTHFPKCPLWFDFFFFKTTEMLHL